MAVIASETTMPCSDSQYDVTPHDFYPQHPQTMPCSGGPTQAQVIEQELKKMDPLLCSACRALERLKYDFDENPELSRWWAAHKAEDEKAARKKEAALARRKLAQHLLTKRANEWSSDDKKLLRDEGFL